MQVKFRFSLLTTLYALCLGLSLSGCDAVMSHPALTPAAKQLIRDGIRETQALRTDVDQFVGGFRLATPERNAVNQMVSAMFMVYEIRDAGGFVRVAVEIKRAQLCLLAVGIESSGVIEELKQVIFQDEAGQRYWTQLESYSESGEVPKLDGLVCND